MDMQIPVMDGYSATRFIRASESQNELEPVRIIALTAHAFNEEVERMLASGCDMHISKPVRKASLLEVIEAFAIESGGDSLPGATRSELGEKAAEASQIAVETGQPIHVQIDEDIVELIDQFLENRHADVGVCEIAKHSRQIKLVELIGIEPTTS